MALGIQNAHAARILPLNQTRKQRFALHAQENFLYFAKPAMVQV
jgi:hypothetical protein